MGETYPRPYADYVLLERLGSGGMSEVDLARKVVDHQSFVRFAVIKRIKADRSADESFVRMFRDEARITSELHHEKIGTVYDFGKVGDEYYLALEYVAGIDVRHLINVLRERGQRVPVRVALKIVADVLDALEYAHTKRDTFGKRMGIVHRDVNPRNIMISIRGDIKLIDFGVAKATDRLERTSTDHVKGKVSYMAPEQITGQAVDHRADLYAVGLTLHELLSGTSPFFGLNQVQVLHRMLAGRPAMPNVPEVSEVAGLQRVHDRALASSPADRYASAAEMASDLRAVADTLGGLPTGDQLAAFLSAVDPELTHRLQAKMESYARVEITETGEITAPPAPELDAAPLVSDPHGTLAEPESLTVTRIGVLGGSVVLASLVSAVVAAAAVTVLLVGGYLLFAGGHQGPPDEELTVPLPTPPPPMSTAPVVPAAHPDPAPAAPEPHAEPVPQPAIGPRPVRPVPPPAPPPPPDPEPEPVAPVAPVPEPVAQPVVSAPEPVVAPSETGLLNVNSDPKGLAVLVDGEEVGITPLRGYRVPVGRHTVGVAGKSCDRSVTIQKNANTNVTCQ
ncbi:MAG: serine/threonine protein kinase [Alphaproteobacteria bacterium]|nr:serine/threonine protein kinase [Alphaproteobacteria bacterium]MCB9696439.1 serine/threonine protein kinase [Alphaproteobacteria bacterium]